MAPCRDCGTPGSMWLGAGVGVGGELQLELPALRLRPAGSLRAEESSETFVFSVDLERKCAGYHTLGSSTPGIFMRKIGHIHVAQRGPARYGHPTPSPPPLLLCSFHTPHIQSLTKSYLFFPLNTSQICPLLSSSCPHRHCPHCCGLSLHYSRRLLAGFPGTYPSSLLR